MIDPFVRGESAAHTRGLRRLVVLAVVVGAAGAVWHAVRPGVVRCAAQSSLGLTPRTGLIFDALNRIYPPLPERRGERYPLSFSNPPAGCATWPIDPIMQYQGGRRAFVPARHVFVDGRLDPRGMVRAEFPFIAAPYTDRSGRLLIVFRYNWLQQPAAPRYIVASVIIRLGAETNEIVAVFAVVIRLKPSVIRQIHYGWRDEDDDGTLEFVVLAQNPAMRKQPRAPIETLAVLRWDATATALRVVQSPSDGSMLIWTPPDGRPHEFPQTAVIDDICCELLPLPDDFGQPSTPPATQSSQPAP